MYIIENSTWIHDVIYWFRYENYNMENGYKIFRASEHFSIIYYVQMFHCYRTETYITQIYLTNKNVFKQ